MTAKTKSIPRSILAIALALLICFGPSLTALAENSDGGSIASDITAYGAGYINKPPEGYGTNIADYFRIIRGSTDPVYPNVAVITNDVPNQYGAMWAKEKLDLTLPFSTEMYLHLGHESGKNGGVADGITFTLHNDAKGLDAIGGVGEGLGVFRGRRSTGGTGTVPDGTYLRNSLVIEFDTYRNLLSAGAYVDDPTSPGYSAHCALLVPDANANSGIAVFDHKNVFYFNPVQDWVKFDVDWQPNGSGGGMLSYSFGGVSKTYAIPSITSVFGGTNVYWGFTGTTGALSALQAAAIAKLPTQELGVEKTVTNAKGENVDGGSIGETSMLKYTITVSADKAILGVGPIVIIENLSFHTEYAGGNISIVTSDGSSFEVTPTLKGNTLTIDTEHALLNVGDWLTATFCVNVKEGSKGNIVYNTAIADAEGLTEPQNSNSTKVTIVEAPDSPKKTIASDNGKDGSAVAVGDSITYEISYLNYEDSAATITITDKLPDGVDFDTANNDGSYDDGTHTVTWTINNVPGGADGTVTVTAEVNKDAVDKIENTASVKVGYNNPITTNKVENPVTPEYVPDYSDELFEVTSENVILRGNWAQESSGDVEFWVSYEGAPITQDHLDAVTFTCAPALRWENVNKVFHTKGAAVLTGETDGNFAQVKISVDVDASGVSAITMTGKSAELATGYGITPGDTADIYGVLNASDIGAISRVVNEIPGTVSPLEGLANNFDLEMMDMTKDTIINASDTGALSRIINQIASI